MGRLLRAWFFLASLWLAMSCAIDSRTFKISDEAAAGRESGPDASDESGAAGTMADEDSGPGDAGSDTAVPPPPECTKDEDCADEVAECRTGRCDASSGRCELVWAEDCTRCGDGKVCVSGICRIGGEYFTETFDGNALPEAFVTREQAQWMITGDSAYSGRSAVSGRIGDDTESWLQLTLDDVPRQSRISFYRRVDADEHHDALQFGIVANGRNVLIGEWNGWHEWQRIDEDVGAYGRVTFWWSYVKDIELAYGEDRAWIDEIVIWRDCVDLQPSR